MRPFVSLSFLSTLVIAALACTPTGGEFDACTVVTPDAGAGTYACAIGWTCNGGESSYDLLCTFQAGDFACSCVAEGTTTKTFTVNAFTCDQNGALPSAQSACGWNITAQ